MGTQRSRGGKWLPRVLLAGALVLATWPAWHVMMLGENPTLEELLQLLCSSRTQGAIQPGLSRVRQPVFEMDSSTISKQAVPASQRRLP